MGVFTPPPFLGVTNGDSKIHFGGRAEDARLPGDSVSRPDTRTG